MAVGSAPHDTSSRGATPPHAPTFDLARFDLRDMTALGSVLRRLGDGATSMEEAADRIVRCLFDRLRSPGTATPSCALVRIFKTHPFGALDAALQSVASAHLPEASLSATLKCLTLLASAGEQPSWNGRAASIAHKAIPLLGEKMVAKTPMISELLQQLGVEVGLLVGANSRILLERSPSTFQVFYVPEAPGSPYIPAQREFVIPARIRSVLGFGGMLPAGDIFAVILFAKVRVPRQTAELFKTLALNVKIALLPFTETVFGRGARAGR